jgi:Xaa-Pro aminopeptidase
MQPFAERRRRALAALRGVAIVPSAPVQIRNNDVEHAYRQDSDLYYFTGFEESESVLLLSSVHAEHRAVMFVRERDAEREAWDGARAGVDGARASLGVDACFPITELRQKLPEYLAGAPELVYEVGKRPSLDEIVFASITQARARGRTPKPWPKTITHPERIWHEHRLCKDDGELALVRRAVEITTEGHLAVMAARAPGRHEYEMEALLREIFRRRGSDRCAYEPIVGSGPNATVLHYRTNNRRMEEGELLLVDAGAEYGYYAADVTRTLPVSGRFTAPQRRLYRAVLDAQLAAIERARPGATIEQIHGVVVRRLTESMVELGLLAGDVDKLIEEETFKRYYMHRTSHWLGMDVHDVGAYFVEGDARPLGPGMVLTIEPGLYVAAQDEAAPAELRGLGVRIEDDVLITDDGHEVLSAGIPKEPDEVERACG